MSDASNTSPDGPKNSQGRERVFLAVIIILPAFLLIGYMLNLQYTTNDIATKVIADGNSNSSRIIAATALYKEIEQSNQNIFAILLSVFGAWVGAVVAYFFGAQTVQKIQDSASQTLKETQTFHSNDLKNMGQAISKQDKLSKTTVAELLEKNHDSKYVKKADITVKMVDLTPKFDEIANVVILRNNKPIGVLYAADYFKAFDKTYRESSSTLEEVLKEKVAPKPKDIVTGKQWTNDGLKNFAELSMTDSLTAASEKMRAISDHPAGRGIVLAESGEPFAVINYEMINALA
jgi:hypothetical protein